MFSKLFGRKKPEPVVADAPPPPPRQVPLYAALLAQPVRALPASLQANEESAEFAEFQGKWQERLRTGKRPGEDVPAITTLAAGQNLATFAMPDTGERAALFFSSPLRAADYKDHMGRDGAGAEIPMLTMTGFLQMLRDLEGAGVKHFAFDRCPRCTGAAVAETGTVQSPDDAWAARCRYKGAEIAREKLYFEFALDASRAGHLEEAREVALHAIGHITFEDPNMHLLLGQVGVALADTALASDALAMLRFLKAEPYAAKLSTVMEIGAADFEGPDA
ncbi:MAG: hypothetical protein U0704_14635 [Candidatus Eisenbacteria bacterium]